MKLTKNQLESRIKNLNDWLIMNSKGIHFEYAENKNKRDYYVSKLIDLENYNLENIDIQEQSTWPIERDTLDLREHNFN